MSFLNSPAFGVGDTAGGDAASLKFAGALLGDFGAGGLDGSDVGNTLGIQDFGRSLDRELPLLRLTAESS